MSFLSDGCTKTANTMEEAKMGREVEGTAQVSMRSEHAESLKDGESGMIMIMIMTCVLMKNLMSLLKPGSPDLDRRNTVA